MTVQELQTNEIRVCLIYCSTWFIRWWICVLKWRTLLLQCTLFITGAVPTGLSYSPATLEVQKHDIFLWHMDKKVIVKAWMNALGWKWGRCLVYFLQFKVLLHAPIFLDTLQSSSCLNMSIFFFSYKQNHSNAPIVGVRRRSWRSGAQRSSWTHISILERTGPRY